MGCLSIVGTLQGDTCQISFPLGHLGPSGVVERGSKLPPPPPGVCAHFCEEAWLQHNTSLQCPSVSDHVCSVILLSDAGEEPWWLSQACLAGDGLVAQGHQVAEVVGAHAVSRGREESSSFRWSNCTNPQNPKLKNSSSAKSRYPPTTPLTPPCPPDPSTSLPLPIRAICVCVCVCEHFLVKGSILYKKNCAVGKNWTERERAEAATSGCRRWCTPRLRWRGVPRPPPWLGRWRWSTAAGGGPPAWPPPRWGRGPRGCASGGRQRREMCAGGGLHGGAE